MLQKFFLSLFFLTALGTTPLLSIGYCSDCLGSGFLAGGYGTLQIFVFHTKDSAFDSEDEDFWEYDASQRAAGGGGFIGYGIPFCERFNLAFKVTASGFSSAAFHSYFDDNPSQTYRNKMRVKYMIDLSLEPGALIGNRLLLYAKFGASYVGLRQTREIVRTAVPTIIFGQDKQNYHNWGYLFGVGAQTLITRCLSAFVELDGHSYPLNTPQKRVDNNDDEGEFLEYRLTRLFGYGFRFGLMAQF